MQHTDKSSERNNPFSLSEAALAKVFDSHQLSQTQRTIAEVILANPIETLFLRGSHLADRAGVSQASVTRFAQKLGYDTLADMFADLRSRALVNDRDLPNGLNRYQKLVADEQRNLDILNSNFGDVVRLRYIARALLQQDVIPILGAGGSSPLVSYFTTSLGAFHDRVILVNSLRSSGISDILRSRRAGATWVVCFLFDPIPSEVRSLVQDALSFGLKIAAISDRRYRYTENIAEFTSVASASSGFRFPPLVAPFVLVATLVELLLEEMDAAAISRLTEYENAVSSTNSLRSLDYDDQRN